MKFLIVIASRDCMKYLPECVDSVVNQDYENYEVVITDDYSADEGQAQFIRNFVKDKDNWYGFYNEERKGALFSQVNSIRTRLLHDDDVIVFLDGDDKFAHSHVLSHLVHYYDNGAYMTYGSYAPDPMVKVPNPAMPYARECVVRNDYRNPNKWGIQFNHLRTLKHKLFIHLEDSDFQFENGDWFTVAGDTAVMIPALELAGGNYRFVQEVLLLYTTDSPHADWKIHAEEIDRSHYRIFKELLPKQPLDGVII